MSLLTPILFIRAIPSFTVADSSDYGYNGDYGFWGEQSAPDNSNHYWWGPDWGWYLSWVNFILILSITVLIFGSPRFALKKPVQIIYPTFPLRSQVASKADTAPKEPEPAVSAQSMPSPIQSPQQQVGQTTELIGLPQPSVSMPRETVTQTPPPVQQTQPISAPPYTSTQTQSSTATGPAWPAHPTGYQQATPQAAWSYGQGYPQYAGARQPYYQQPAPSQPVPPQPDARSTSQCGPVEVMRGYDHFQGFVRFKVGILNPTQTVVYDVRLSMRMDREALRLDHVEPELDVSGSEILVGSVEPGQRKALALFYDPQICGATPAEGLVTYKEATGQLCTIPMKKIMVEVKCPLIFRPEEANTAIIKNLLEQELISRDAKIYSMPAGLDRAKVFSIAKETVKSLDVCSVSESSRGRNMEAWFYGQVKDSDERLVLRSSVVEDNVELFVAANSRTAITGLLAELGHQYNRKMKEVGFRTVQITNVEIRDSVINRSTLLVGPDPGQGPETSPS